MAGGPDRAGTRSVRQYRVALYERLMEAQERIAHARYAYGASDATVEAALDAADGLSPEERGDDLYLASLERYITALGGRLEVRAVFPEGVVQLPSGAVVSGAARRRPAG
jgi:hypothetical protein